MLSGVWRQHGAELGQGQFSLALSASGAELSGSATAHTGWSGAWTARRVAVHVGGVHRLAAAGAASAGGSVHVSGTNLRGECGQRNGKRLSLQVGLGGLNPAQLGLYKILFYLKAFVHESIILLSPPPACMAHTVAVVLHVYCAIYGAPPIPLVYAIHHAISAMAISSKGRPQRHALNTANLVSRLVSRLWLG